MSTQKREFQVRSAHIEDLVKKLEAADDPELHASALELVKSIMEIHAEVLDRMLGAIAETGERDQLIRTITKDELVSSVLLLHGLHPEDIRTRILQGLANVRPDLKLQGANVELVSLEDGVLRLRIVGGYGPGGQALTRTVEDAIYEIAPDVTQVLMEEIFSPPAHQPSASGLVVLR